MLRALWLSDFYHQVQRLPDGLCGAVGNESSPSGVRLDQPFLAKSFHRFAHSSATHTEALGKVPLGGELVAGFQIAFDYGFFDLLNNLLIKARSANQFVHEPLPRTRDGARRGAAVAGPATIPQNRAELTG